MEKLKPPFPNGLPHKLPGTVEELVAQLDAIVPRPQPVPSPDGKGFDLERLLAETCQRNLVDMLIAARDGKGG